MNHRICPSCKGNAYSAYDGPVWKCPYCGKNIGEESRSEDRDSKRVVVELERYKKHKTS